MRLFISINFDSTTKDYLETIQDQLRRLSSGNYSSRDNLHLTLAFLGEVEERKLPLIQSVLERIPFSFFDLTFSKPGCFSGDSELWWIGLKENPTLLKYQEQLTSKLENQGFILDKRKFKPHITLGRELNIGKAAIQVPEYSFTASRVSLMHSHRVNGRLTYTEIYGVDGNR